MRLIRQLNPRKPVKSTALIIGGWIIGCFGLLALISLFWTPYEAFSLNIPDRLQGPSRSHLLGTDHFGRDILSQLMVGAMNSLSIASGAVVIGVLGGIPIGLVGAIRGGWLGEGLMRLSDLTFAFPALLSAVILAALYGPSGVNVVLAVGIFNIAVFARIPARGATGVMALPFIQAAKAIGRTSFSIAYIHILPNLAALLVIQATIQISIAILAEAGLSYLGLGLQPPSPSWGKMLSDAQTYMFLNPWQAIFPGFAIMLLVWGLNIFGDGLRDYWDPKVN